MSTIFNKLLRHADNFKHILSKRAFLKDEKHSFPWDNFIYESGLVRRAHLDIVDRRETKKLYMMHLCVFPKIHDPLPIYGFDLIAGPNKVTGAFHDFSPTADANHPFCKWFEDEVKDLEWSRQRDLPDWAKNIFSKRMIAAGNIQTPEELDVFLNLSTKTLLYYLDNIYHNTNKLTYEQKQNNDYSKQQNNYCINQKKNPHTPRVMESLGFEPDMVQDFIQNCLFPEV